MKDRKKTYNERLLRAYYDYKGKYALTECQHRKETFGLFEVALICLYLFCLWFCSSVDQIKTSNEPLKSFVFDETQQVARHCFNAL